MLAGRCAGAHPLRAHAEISHRRCRYPHEYERGSSHSAARFCRRRVRDALGRTVARHPISTPAPTPATPASARRAWGRAAQPTAQAGGLLARALQADRARAPATRPRARRLPHAQPAHTPPGRFRRAAAAAGRARSRSCSDATPTRAARLLSLIGRARCGPRPPHLRGLGSGAVLLPGSPQSRQRPRVLAHESEPRSAGSRLSDP